MTKSLICALCCALEFTSIAQSPEETPTLPNLLLNTRHVSTNAQYGTMLKSNLQNKLHTQFQVTTDAVYLLDLTIEVGNSRTIEGMDTRTFADVTFHYALQNLISGSTLASGTSDVSGRAVNEAAAVKDAIRKFTERPEIAIGLRQAVDLDIRDYFGENCNNALEQIPVKGNEVELTRAFIAMEYLNEGNCAKRALVKTEAVMRELDRVTCETVMYDLEIKISSGIYNPNEVLRQLLRISPSATCADKAVELAKKMGESRTRLQAKEREAVDNYIHIYMQTDDAIRFPGYRRLYWRYY